MTKEVQTVQTEEWIRKLMSELQQRIMRLVIGMEAQLPDPLPDEDVIEIIARHHAAAHCEKRVVCPACAGQKRHVTYDMALDAGDSSLYGQPIPCTTCHDDGWIIEAHREKPAPSYEELVVEIARELYDRFVMGGWEPQDAYPQIREWISDAEQLGVSRLVPSVSDPPPSVDTSQLCMVACGAGDYPYCSLLKNHTGMHVAYESHDPNKGVIGTKARGVGDPPATSTPGGER